MYTITFILYMNYICKNNQIFMAFEQGGMASGLLIIAISIVFAAGFGFLVLHFVPGTPF